MTQLSRAARCGAIKIVLVQAADVRCNRTASEEAEEEASLLPTLVLPRRGVFRYRAAGRTVVADANTALLFHPDVPYSITHPTDDGDDCIALRYDRDVATDALGAASETAAAWILDARTQRLAHREAYSVLSESDDLARDERALDILATIASAPPVIASPRDGKRIENIREQIAANLGEHLSLAALAGTAGLSPFHLARRFRAYTGTSMHQYRLALRLGVARARIRDDASNLSRLALDLGFATPAHFSAAFRAAFGCNPSAAHQG